MNGKGTLIHPSGEKYSGDFKDDKKHGKGYYINPNGMNYEGSYKNDVFHGKGKFIDPNGKVIEGTFKEGKFINELCLKIDNKISYSTHPLELLILITISRSMDNEIFDYSNDINLK